MSGRDRVEAEVMRALREALPRGRPIRPGDRLIEDLGIDTDAATRLAWDIETVLGVDLPRDDYKAVLTVEALIDLVDRHYDPATADPKHGWHM
ncbi:MULTISPECIES: acyl carrier protein [Inquilinus]|uniref:Acyl carrier protein n=1 Tax=Inquilinus ginsengisoli TaxID=363840 RepID=A0ABU1JLE1_9PROT|nr:acyl carrier protein [Inquilinus ginsengisoli]MDR6288360.1 acyl carrier protein [Inquilinus ginsengisoli]